MSGGKTEDEIAFVLRRKVREGENGGQRMRVKAVEKACIDRNRTVCQHCAERRSIFEIGVQITRPQVSVPKLVWQNPKHGAEGFTVNHQFAEQGPDRWELEPIELVPYRAQ